jgi:hypothetical protein
MTGRSKWKIAKKNDNTLKGRDWPEKLFLNQIAKLLYPESDRDYQDLVNDMLSDAETGDLEFDDVYVSYHWDDYIPVSAFGSNPLLDRHVNTRIEEDRLELMKRHQPVAGWIEALKSIEKYTCIKLNKNPCGCEYDCTVQAVYKNGLPKRWRVEVAHDNGQVIKFSCTAVPLMNAKQCHDYLNSIKLSIPEDSTLNGWGSQNITNENTNLVSYAGTSEKTIQPSTNEFEFSGLLHKPNGVDNWFEVIDAMTKDYYIKNNNVMPTKAQAWVQLCENPPNGYGITTDDNQSLKMKGINNSFNRRAFTRRWEKYTAKSNPYKPN